MQIQEREISRVLIVDDDETAQEVYTYPVEDLNLEPHIVNGPIETPQSFVANITSSDVVLCDYQLKKRRYSLFNGDLLSEECFKANIPAILCTTYTDIHDTMSRRSLRYIPALIKSDNPEPDMFVKAWEQCISELKGIYNPTRKPWRTLVRIEELDDERNSVYVVVPAWNVHKKVRINRDDIPLHVSNTLTENSRYHVQVNTGAEGHEELFFDEWESK